MGTSFVTVFRRRVGRILIGMILVAVAIAVDSLGDGPLEGGMAVLVGVTGAVGILIGVMGFIGAVSDLRRSGRVNRGEQ